MILTLTSEQGEEDVCMTTEVIELDDAVAFLDRFLKASGYIYPGTLSTIQPLPDYVEE